MWRKRMQDLSRTVGRPHVPLFAPLLFGVAARIEAIAPQAMAVDATRLRKNVGELRRMLKTDAAFCCAPDDDVALAFGSLGSDITPEAVAAHERIAASLEALKQWQADTSEPVLVAAVQGPASMAASLRRRGVVADDETLFDHLGRGLATLARLYCEAGVHVLQWCETQAPPDDQVDAWKGALGTAGNVARFHRVAPVLVMNVAGSIAWPTQAVACPTSAQHAGAMVRPHGRAWQPDPREWGPLTGEAASERLVLTTGEVPSDADITQLLAAVRRVQGQ